MSRRPSKRSPQRGIACRSRREAAAADWDAHYLSGHLPWRSSGIGEIVRKFLKSDVVGSNLLEVGCGVGDDANEISDLGFVYCGIDSSRSAIELAKAKQKHASGTFVAADFFTWKAAQRYDVVYDKGTFHNLAGPRRRTLFAQRVASVLQEGGTWVTVAGADEYPGGQCFHPAIFLTHLVESIEPYFEVLTVIKGPYGVRRPTQEFNAWYGLFRKWR